jgi:GcrA cell cycle regulator
VSTEFTWTEEATEFLVRAWKARKGDSSISADTIAKQLGTTRNAVLGKVNRLGMSDPKGKRGRKPILRVNGSGAPVANPAYEGPVYTPAPAKPKPAPDPIEVVLARTEPEPPEPPPPPSDGIPMADLRLSSCRWPMPGRDEWGICLFCGKHAPKQPYCDEHSARAFVPNTKKARLAPRT